MKSQNSTNLGLNIPNVVIQTEPESFIGKIDWSDYNFPPFIHIVHFSISELEGSLRRFVVCIYINYLILLGILLLNGNIFGITISFIDIDTDR